VVVRARAGRRRGGLSQTRRARQGPPCRCRCPCMASRLMRLRRTGACRSCTTEVPNGTDAWWDPTARTITCVPCDAEAPADPFAVVAEELRGSAGGSAQAFAERRSGRDASNWRKGAEGEQKVSSILRAVQGVDVLDDRRIPGSSANIDHIAVAASGVYVVDAKKIKGTVEVEVNGFGRWRTETLKVNGRNRTNLVEGVHRQASVVNDALVEYEVPVIPVLCFVGSENWGIFTQSLQVDGVRVLSGRALKKLVRRDGPVDASVRQPIARVLAARLKPAA